MHVAEVTGQKYCLSLQCHHSYQSLDFEIDPLSSVAGMQVTKLEVLEHEVT